LKTPAAIFVLFALAYQCLGSLGVFVWYGANREYIATNWCVNRDKPMLHCNGQCILAKKLRSLDDSGGREPHHGNTGMSKLEIPAFIPQYQVTTPTLPQESRRQPVDSYFMPYTYFFCADVFRPPIA